MSCNCKKKTDKLVHKVEDLNKSKSKNYVNTNKTLLKLIFSSLSVLIYTIFGIILILSIVPIFLYMIISGKSFTIRKPKLLNNVWK